MEQIETYVLVAFVLLLYASFFLWLIRGSRYELQSKIITGVGGIIFIISLFIKSPFLQIIEAMLLIIGPVIGIYGNQKMCISPRPIYIFVAALVLEQAIAHGFNLDFIKYTTITETGRSTQLIGPATAIPIILGITAFYRCRAVARK
jgi:hypothetical protein